MKHIYSLLYKAYGAQKWWPVTSKNEQFEIILGTILTQNTSWKNVETAIANLNSEKLIDPAQIARVDTQKLAALIKPSGYFNQKAERLKIMAKFFLDNKNLSVLHISELRKKLLEIKGVGPETADSIVLYAFNKPSFVVDLYTKRIFSRLGLCSKNCSYDELQKMFHDALPKDAQLFNEYHALIVEHAKQHCKKMPVCKNCPLSDKCKKLM